LLLNNCHFSNYRFFGRKLTLIITGIVLGIACALTLALLPLYLSKNDSMRSDQNGMYLRVYRIHNIFANENDVF